MIPQNAINLLRNFPNIFGVPQGRCNVRDYDAAFLSGNIISSFFEFSRAISE